MFQCAEAFNQTLSAWQVASIDCDDSDSDAHDTFEGTDALSNCHKARIYNAWEPMHKHACGSTSFFSPRNALDNWEQLTLQKTPPTPPSKPTPPPPPPKKSGKCPCALAAPRVAKHLAGKHSASVALKFEKHAPPQRTDSLASLST